MHCGQCFFLLDNQAMDLKHRTVLARSKWLFFTCRSIDARVLHSLQEKSADCCLFLYFKSMHTPKNVSGVIQNDDGLSSPCFLCVLIEAEPSVSLGRR